MSDEDVESRLREVVDRLKQGDPFSCPLPERHSAWLAAAFESFLDGKTSTLDQAFGLVKARGRQANETRNQLIADEWARCGFAQDLATVSARLAARWEEIAKRDKMPADWDPHGFRDGLETVQISRALKDKAGSDSPAAIQALANELAARLRDRRAGPENDGGQ